MKSVKSVKSELVTILTASMIMALVAPGSGITAPTRIVSTNLCADQLVLQLADRDQIASVSRTALEPALSNTVKLARGVPVNHARTEEIAVFKPDLVISGQDRELAMNTMLQRLGFRVATIVSPQSVTAGEAVIRQIANLTGHVPRGEAMIAKMHERLKELERLKKFGRAHGPRPTTIVYQAKGGTIGTKTLAGELIALAGLDNLARRFGIERWGSLTLEQVAEAAPDLLIFETDGQQGASLAQQAQRHPLLRELAARHMAIEIPTKLWVCPGPWNIDAVARMAEARQHLLNHSDTTP